MLGLTKSHMGLEPWVDQPHGSTLGNTVPWHMCTHTRTRTCTYCWSLGMRQCSQAEITLIQTESSSTFHSGVCTPWAASQLPPGTATKAAMRHTCWEAFLLVMKNKLPAAKSRDGHTHTHTHTLQDTHSHSRIIGGPVWRAAGLARIYKRRRYSVVFQVSTLGYLLFRGSPPAISTEKKRVQMETMIWTYKLLKVHKPLALKCPDFQNRKTGWRGAAGGGSHCLSQRPDERWSMALRGLSSLWGP